MQRLWTISERTSISCRIEKGRTIPHVVKVKRYGGGYSVIDIASDKETAEALAKEFNDQYQTDTYYVEPYRSRDEYGADHEGGVECHASSTRTEITSRTKPTT